jgi:hypothetical protein
MPAYTKFHPRTQVLCIINSNRSDSHWTYELTSSSFGIIFEKVVYQPAQVGIVQVTGTAARFRPPSTFPHVPPFRPTIPTHFASLFNLGTACYLSTADPDGSALVRLSAATLIREGPGCLFRSLRLDSAPKLPRLGFAPYRLGRTTHPNNSDLTMPETVSHAFLCRFDQLRYV